MNKVFLGGTCNASTWRDQLMPLLQTPYFNPVVLNWTPQDQITEDIQKEVNCNIHLYVITEVSSIYSIAEAVDSANTHGKVTILQVIPDNFSAKELKHMKAIIKLVHKAGGIAYIGEDINSTAKLINACSGITI